ncbi:MAG: type II secretion system protein [Tepidisphaeraceae bacterium]
MTSNRSLRRAVTLVDLLVMLAMIALMMTLSLCSGQRSRETANRAKCLSNLKMIGTACRVYETANNGQYPRAIYKPVRADEPYTVTWGTPYTGPDDAKPSDKADTFGRNKDATVDGANPPEDNDVTASLFLLVRTCDMPAEVFVCPSTKQKPFDFGTKAAGRNIFSTAWTNWPGKTGIAQHLSYGVHNMYPNVNAVAIGFAWNSSRLTSEFAIAGDMSPGGNDLLKITVNSPAREMRKGNSLNHAGEGENVLYGDGHADWSSTPFNGVNRDNIYTARTAEAVNEPSAGGDPKKVVLVGSPVGPDDSILLPHASDVGATVRVATRSSPTVAMPRRCRR